jgi:CO/xanthine dehydrogenase FAD-binding subunit
MNQAKYLRPGKLEDVLQALQDWGDRARVLAGGTDLLIGLRRGIVKPGCVVDITGLDELSGIHQENGIVTIGALTTHSEVCQSEAMASWAPVLGAACREVGSRQIRNRASIGGNLAHASPAGDTIPAFYVLNAEIQLRSSQGERWISAKDFFTGPGESVRRADELLTAVRLSCFEGGEKGFFRKIGQRRAMTISKVSAAGALVLKDNVVHRCRFALGAVAPTVIRLPDLEAFLSGKQLLPGVIEEAAQIAAQASLPIDDIRSTVEYRRHMAGVLVKRGLNAIMEEV